jgi:hypothetical protein
LFKLAANVSLLELVAAYGKLFFHYRKTNLGKRNEQFTEKLAMSFSIC